MNLNQESAHTVVVHFGIGMVNVRDVTKMYMMDGQRCKVDERNTKKEIEERNQEILV